MPAQTNTIPSLAEMNAPGNLLLTCGSRVWRVRGGLAGVLHVENLAMYNMRQRQNYIGTETVEREVQIPDDKPEG